MRASRPLHTASVTTVLVGVTAARSVALGRLGLDDQVCRWVPSWSSDGRSRITLRHLLGHASGLDASTWSSVASGPVDDLLAHMVEELPLVHEPGTHVAYDNLAAMVVPAVVARAAGRDFSWPGSTTCRGCRATRRTSRGSATFRTWSPIWTVP